MDIPVKFDVPRLSHSDLLNVLGPILPGTVIGINFLRAWPAFTLNLSSVGLGYKTTVLLSVGVAYVLGVVALWLTAVIGSALLNCVVRRKITSPYSNLYWRQLVTNYLGERLIPSGGTGEAPDRLVDQALSFGTIDRESKNRYDELTELMETIEEESNRLLKDLNYESAVEEVIELNRRKELVKSTRSELASFLQEQLIELQWLQVYLGMLWFDDDEGPNEKTKVFLTALQAMSLCEIVLPLILHIPSHVSFLFLSVVVFGLSSYFQWDIKKFEVRTVRAFMPQQTGALIAALKGGRDKSSIG